MLISGMHILMHPPFLFLFLFLFLLFLVAVRAVAFKVRLVVVSCWSEPVLG
jgi:hypothetical protein